MKKVKKIIQTHQKINIVKHLKMLLQLQNIMFLNFMEKQLIKQSK